MNIDELEHAVIAAEQRVLKIQTKLHSWARDDAHRRFDDLFNLVADAGFLLVAWDRVRGNKHLSWAENSGASSDAVAARDAVISVDVVVLRLFPIIVFPGDAENALAATVGVEGIDTPCLPMMDDRRLVRITQMHRCRLSD